MHVQESVEIALTTQSAQYVESATRQSVTIIRIDSRTSVFNTDVSLPYNHNFIESLIVKKMKVDGKVTQCDMTTIIPRCLTSGHSYRQSG
ncbi:hypothetical protein T265_08790 [Opisthorchis viverrini]|uniref:Uncharacterized protein n=1 Tax=Opisthorchis viverrini TaxID=6198 RepID=A0A074ZCH7_OPIVI|nr:hypothetical protein T265_08790 [Opisthorchis viverrini]KER23307.1 hypothetical protein T265_08790 [Opisthorchis viverrini]